MIWVQEGSRLSFYNDLTWHRHSVTHGGIHAAMLHICSNFAVTEHAELDGFVEPPSGDPEH